MSDVIILAADGLDLDATMRLTEAIGDKVYAVKIHELYDAYGPAVVDELRRAGARRVWVDAKLHDIPNTVRLRAKALASAGADIVTVHAAGEVEMIKAAAESGIPEVYAVTVLTSITDAQVQRLYGMPVREVVAQLARLAAAGSATGVVCSPHEVTALTEIPKVGMLKLVVPGVRSAGKDAGDQRRVGTPAAAVLAGATHLVVGRQITQAPDPVSALAEIEAEIDEALAMRDAQIVS